MGCLMNTGAPAAGYFPGPTLKEYETPKKILKVDTSHPGSSLDRANTSPEIGEEVTTALKTGKADSVFRLRPGTNDRLQNNLYSF